MDDYQRVHSGSKIDGITFDKMCRNVSDGSKVRIQALVVPKITTSRRNYLKSSTSFASLIVILERVKISIPSV
jgi:hypothetical protein